MAYRVLVVDDSWKDIEGILRYLKFEGYNTFVAANGIEAIEILKREHVDYLILDIDMPQMTGDNLIKHIKTDKHLKEKDIPGVICTSVLDRNKVLEGKSQHLINAIESGEYTLFTKPVVIGKLFMKIKDTLHARTDSKKDSFSPKWTSLTREEEDEYNMLGWKLYKKYGDQDKWNHKDPDFKRFDGLSTKRIKY